MIQRIGALLVLMGVLLLVAIPVMADSHTPNQVGYWCEMGEKFDDLEQQSFVVPAPPDGYVIGLVVVKAGSEQSTDEPHAEFYGVQAGDTLVHPSGKDISHVIVCYEPEGTTTTTEQTTTTTEPVVTTTTTTPTVVTIACVDDCPETTTTVQETTTTESVVTTTTKPPTASTLPVTGAEEYAGTAAVAGGLMLAGAAALAAARFAKAD